MTTACSTPVVACPAPAAGANTCYFSARAVAGAAVGVAVGGKAVSNATATFTPDAPGSPVQKFSSSVSANCTAGLAILGGCAGQTDNTHDTAQQNGFAGTGKNLLGFPGTFASGGQGVCLWSGGPIAVLATVSCTEEVDYFLVNAG
jgi:hypothetical protein